MNVVNNVNCEVHELSHGNLLLLLENSILAFYSRKYYYFEKNQLWLKHVYSIVLVLGYWKLLCQRQCKLQRIQLPLSGLSTEIIRF